MENDEKRFGRLEETLAKAKHQAKSKIRVVEGDALSYEYTRKRLAKQGKILPVRTRIIDFGFGIGFEGACRIMTHQLHKQRRQNPFINGKKLPRAFIFDGATRQKSWKQHLKVFNQVLDVLHSHVVSINGIRVEDMQNLGNENPFKGEHGKLKLTYRDKKTGHINKVYEHEVVLADSKHHPKLHMFSSVNGTTMLSCMLVYDLKK